MTQANKFAKKWNDKAASLGCRARIWYKSSQQQIFEFRNTFTKGSEIWFPITQEKFAQLIQGYSEFN